MSKGPGKWQRLILTALDEVPIAPLYSIIPKDATYSDYKAIHRAVSQLDKQGKIAKVLLWDDNPRCLITYIARPDFVVKDKPIKSLSVERVPNGTGSTFMGSLRYIASFYQVGKTTVWKALQEQHDK